MVLPILFILGCGDLTPSKSASAESTRILEKLRDIEEVEPDISLPASFTILPKIVQHIVGGKKEYKLFYFCQHHTSTEMKSVVYEQFASALFDAKGKSSRVADYTVSSNESTNQLIVRCPDMNDAKSVFDFLRNVDVPPIQVKIDCLISEIYADKTLDWETTLEVEDLFGTGIWGGPAGKSFGSAIEPLVEETSIAAFPGGSLRELGRSKMGLKVGYLSNDNKFLSLVDTLESEGYLKILMNPTLEVVNGKTAKVSSTQKVPLNQIFLKSGNSELFESKTEYEDVVDSLEITPHVFADGYIGLETKIILGSKLTPEGIKQVPIITKKEIENAENRVMPGHSLIIGGMRKTEKRDVLRGIPFLKDIPIIGILFSGRDFEERAVETIFVLTPSVSRSGVPRAKMMEKIKERRVEKNEN